MTSTEPLTQAQLETGLRALGVADGMSLEVHSSLSAFGPVAGGAATVIAALQRIVGSEGAIVMPAFPLSRELPLTEADLDHGVVVKMAVLDPGSPCRTGMGVIADTFRRLPDVVVGHGFHRLCAWGRDAEEHSKGFCRLMDVGGYALLLGVDIHRLSAMHHAESRAGGVPAAVRACFAAGEDLARTYPRDRWYVEVGATPHDGWAKVQDEAAGRGLVREARIGAARCLLMPVPEVIGIYEHALRADPYGLFGIDPADVVAASDW